MRYFEGKCACALKRKCIKRCPFYIDLKKMKLIHSAIVCALVSAIPWNCSDGTPESQTPKKPISRQEFLDRVKEQFQSLADAQPTDELKKAYLHQYDLWLVVANRTYSEEKPKEGTEEKPKEGTEEKPKEGTEEKPKEGTEEKPKEGTEEKPKEGTEEKPKEGTEEKPKEGTEDKPKEGTEGQQKPE
jgi:outer membrane biosynthesis protein TonB